MSKESIFTGLNNPVMFSVTDEDCDSYFGFTDDEVQKTLDFYGLEEKYDTIRDWYDCYRFGDRDDYCPWDVINYVNKLLVNRKLPPQDYWSNTSSNDIVRHFIERVGSGLTKSEIEMLVAGENVGKEICEDLTYNRPYDSLFTDYLGRTISIRDTFSRKPTKENFYHGVLLGILGFKEGWFIRSNYKTSDGYCDIVVKIENEDIGIIIEAKYAEDGQLEAAYENALRQIEEKHYAANLRKEECSRITGSFAWTV